MSINAAAHHHVAEGISIAFHGDLPTDFVIPTADTIASGEAQEYGWSWYRKGYTYVSGRPADHMPATRKIATFGGVDIEGDQVLGPSYYPGEADDFGYRSIDRIMSREQLMGILSAKNTYDLVEGYAYGCFSHGERTCCHHTNRYLAHLCRPIFELKCNQHRC